MVTFLAQFAIVQPTNLLTVVNAPIDSLAIGAPHSFVAIVYVDWLETNIKHTLTIGLFDAAGDAVPAGGEPLQIRMPVEVGRPAGVPRGMTFKIPVALNLTGLHLPAGMYEWKVSVGEVQNPEWNNAFMLLDSSVA